ncbi:MAG: radical SAM protein [Parcubacteria group bacterium Athens0714_12]|nr:MAG: radical SAM protein [Parcubacteria group bacterium Athens0714_12]
MGIHLLVNPIKWVKKNFGKKRTDFLINLISGGENFYYLDKIYDSQQKRLVKRLTLLLPGKGCSWAKISGGCSMCGFPSKVKEIGKKFSADDLIGLYKIAELMTIEERPENLTIYNAGSFLNDEEISPKAQIEITNLVKKHPSIKLLFIESRAEFVTSQKIKKLTSLLENKKLEVGIGLEAVNEKVRNKFINKGLSLKTYEEAIKTLKKNKALSSTYVFIKPLYLNEWEAIEEAIITAEYAHKTGSDKINFEAAFVQKGTLLAAFYEKGEFRPPWLWSIRGFGALLKY